MKAIFGAALGFRPVELLDLIGGERVLASHRMTVELLHTLLVGRLDPRGSAFGGGTSLHSGGVRFAAPRLAAVRVLAPALCLATVRLFWADRRLGAVRLLESLVFFGWIALWQPVAYA